MKNNYVVKPENREKVTYIFCLYRAISRDVVGFAIETSGATKNLLFSWSNCTQTKKSIYLSGLDSFCQVTRRHISGITSRNVSFSPTHMLTNH